MSNFIGCPYPIVRNPRGFFATQSDVNQIKSDLLCLLQTNPGERCLTGDTKIPLANGEEHQIKDLIDKSSFWIYSYDKESDSIVAGKATAFKTIENAEIMEITLDNNEKVRCTTNHLWMLRNGEYCRADELKENDSLMPLYRNLNTSGYERIYQPFLKDYKETHKSFIESKRLTGVREVIHHVDLNKKNNSPDNLRWMTWEDHKKLHKDISNAFSIKLKNDPEFRKVWLAKLKNGLKKYYENNNGNRKGAKLSKNARKKLSISKKEYYKTEKGLKNKEILKEKILHQIEENGPLFAGKKHKNESKEKMKTTRPSIAGDKNPSKRADVRIKIKKSWDKRRNHKVIKIEKLTLREDCYDLHVEKYHNFGISAGVFVHNCMLPSFGTPLRNLLFEPNDSILITQARQVIINAIKMWEPRVAIQQLNVFTGSDPATMNPQDTGTEKNSILTISISFVIYGNIQSVQNLTLELPLAQGS